MRVIFQEFLIKLPSFMLVDRQCDGDSPLDLDSQDGLYPFDVSLIEEQVINGQTGVTRMHLNFAFS